MTPYTDEQKADLAKRIEARAERIHFYPQASLAGIVPMAEKVLLKTIAEEIRDGTFFEVQHD